MWGGSLLPRPWGGRSPRLWGGSLLPRRRADVGRQLAAAAVGRPLVAAAVGRQLVAAAVGRPLVAAAVGRQLAAAALERISLVGARLAGHDRSMRSSAAALVAVDACSFLEPTTRFTNFRAQLDGLEDVPTNVVFLGARARATPKDDAWLRDPFGRTTLMHVETVGGVTRVFAPFLLLPRTAYDVWTGLDEESATRVFGFTTGDGEDLDVPAPPAILATEATPDEGWRFPNSCETKPSYEDEVDVTVTVSAGDAAFLTLRVDVSDELGEPGTSLQAAEAPARRARTAKLFTNEQRRGVQTYHVTAYDLAGNASVPETIDIDLGCASVSTPPFAALALFLALRRRAAGASSRPTGGGARSP
jgi:hypothetical protein